ncbi:MAG: ATP phosphoribosyltransferase regulatory subunit, partial [Oscillospiraceae bacterium]|nr:ATP phosphoribosyltransferase regulatory subunit [Oscillospiraceae bacterium]
YDLTLPLTRYFANNRSKLPYPAKIIQMDRVYRAERPQKGRLREFMQCDVDIIGSDSDYSEIELISTVTEALLAITLKNFTVRVNNRRILNDLLLSMGFAAEDLMSVCITFDKMDKVGAEGVEKELNEKNFDAAAVAKFVDFLKQGDFSLGYVKKLMPESEAVQSVEKIITLSNAVSEGKYDVVFDLSLVRGQGYYTGTVFEVVSNEFKGAIAGGGRYDNLIGKFLGESIPAVGFSIGFERIFAILSEQGFTPPTAKKKLAVIFEETNYAECVAKAKELRAEYDVGLYERPKKLGKLLGRLENEGYYGALISPTEEIKVFEK